MIIKNVLDENEINDIIMLNTLCKIERIPNFDSSIFVDPTLPCFYLEYKDEKLISFLNLYYVDNTSIEIIAVTHPSYRKMGYFTLLLKEAMKNIPPSITIKYQIPSNYVDRERLKSYGLVYHHGEEELIKKIPMNVSNLLFDLQVSDIEEAARILGSSFNRSLSEERELLKLWMIDESLRPMVLKDNGKTLGFIVISSTSDLSTKYLFAFCIDEAYRSQGYGKQLLNNLPYNPDGYVLRVYLDNKRAMKFYSEIGFTHLSTTEYFVKAKQSI